MMEQFKGKITRLNEAMTKTGKLYHQIMVEDVFMFWWSDGDCKGLDVGDDVEVSYEPGKFTTLKGIRKVEPVGKNVHKALDYGTFMEYIRIHKELDVDEILDWVKAYPNIDGDEMIQDLLKLGEIYEIRPGKLKILE